MTDLTPQEIETAAGMRTAGMSLKTIARKIHRGVDAFRGQLQIMGLAKVTSPTSWTDERIDRLKAMFAEGCSASKIGRDLGVSRSAIIAKWTRLGLVRDRAIEHPNSNRWPRMPRKPRGTKSPTFRFGNRPRKTGVPLPVDVALLPDCPPAEGDFVPANPKPLLELAPGDCRWPMGERDDPAVEFCADPGARALPYCPHHARIAYRSPAEARRERELRRVA